MQKEGKMFLYTLVDSVDAVMASMCRSFGIEKGRRSQSAGTEKERLPCQLP